MAIRGYDWYEDSYEPDPFENYVHVDKVPDLDPLRKQFLSLIDILYGKSEINVGFLDEKIGDIADLLDLKIPAETLPTIQRESKRSHYLSIGFDLSKLSQNKGI